MNTENNVTNKSKAILLVFVLLISNQLFAFGDKYAASFLKTGSGVREISLGGATVSSADMTSAFYWNPALLSNATTLSGRLMHSEEFGGVLNLDHLSIILPGKHDYNFGMGFIRSGVDDIPLVKESSLIDVGTDGIGPDDEDYIGPDADGSEGNGKLDDGERLDFGKIGTFGASESAFFLSAGKKYNEKISIGLSVKGIYKDLYSSTAFGVGLDIGMIYQLTENMKLAAQISDFTTTYLFWNDGEKEVIAPEIRLGYSARFHSANIPFSFEPMVGLNITMDGEKNNSRIQSDLANTKFVIGSEITYNGLLAFRFGRDENDGFHLGAGVNTHIANINYGISLGGAYDALGKSHQIGLVFNIDEVYSLVKKNL